MDWTIPVKPAETRREGVRQLLGVTGQYASVEEPYGVPMPHQVKAVIARSKGAPVTLETINVPDPGPGEALVQVQACGVCHTDLHYREGGINDDFPFRLGRRRGGRCRGDRARARGLRDPQLARGVRQLPGVPAGRAVVLLRHVQRHPEDDPC
jgi:hypothetical protein